MAWVVSVQEIGGLKMAIAQAFRCVVPKMHKVRTAILNSLIFIVDAISGY